MFSVQTCTSLWLRRLHPSVEQLADFFYFYSIIILIHSLRFWRDTLNREPNIRCMFCALKKYKNKNWFTFHTLCGCAWACAQVLTRYLFLFFAHFYQIEIVCRAFWMPHKMRAHFMPQRPQFTYIILKTTAMKYFFLIKFLFPLCSFSFALAFPWCHHRLSRLIRRRRQCFINKSIGFIYNLNTLKPFQFSPFDFWLKW